MLNGTNVFLVGMMGAGKSTLGRLLASRLSYQFLDTDSLIEACTGKTIPEIFASDGEAPFREVERKVLAQVAAYKRLVVATGGGIVLDSLNWSYLHAGIVVWLDAPVDMLFERIVASPVLRPLLHTPDPKATLAALCEQRRQRYAQADIHILQTPEETPEHTCDRIVAAMQERITRDRFPQNADGATLESSGAGIAEPGE